MESARADVSMSLAKFRRITSRACVTQDATAGHPREHCLESVGPESFYQSSDKPLKKQRHPVPEYGSARLSLNNLDGKESSRDI